MKVSDLFIQCLENEGVRYVFGLPGEEIEDLIFSLGNSSIQFITTRHEQGAAFMADVWGRVTGKAGVCLSTLGPGATNLVTGIADATLDKSPLVAITGQAGRTRIHQDSHQFLDIVNMFRPITKWNKAIASPETVGEVIRKAFKFAESEKPGATHIELSEDVARMETMAKPEPVVAVRRPHPDQKALAEAFLLLKNARRPLLLAGNGAIRKGASRHLRQLVEKHSLPVVHTFMGKGALSDWSEQSLFSVGLGFRDFVMDAFDEADLVLGVGYDIAEYPPDAWNPDGRKKIIHIDFTTAEVYAHYRPQVEIVADIAASLNEIANYLDSSNIYFDPDWYKPVRQRIQTDIANYNLLPGDSFTVPGTLNILRTLMGDEDLLISDVGSHKMWIARNFPVCCPSSCIMSNGLASMGIALPGAVAAALEQPGRRVVASMGDGGFLMNSQELETARRLGVAFTVLVFNDNDYGLISWKQRMHGGRVTGTRITNPDFKKYAESFGIKAYSPRTLEQLSSDLKLALNQKELSVVDIPIDPMVGDQLVKRLRNGSP
jgi:acetolactate synthase I/II/III large subunit